MDPGYFLFGTPEMPGTGADLGGGRRGCAPPSPPWEQEQEQETSAPPPKKNPGSALQAACLTGLCLFALLGIVKSSSSGTIQVLILKPRYLVIRQEVFDGFNHFTHIKILSKALLMSRRTMAVSFLSFYQWHSGFHRWSE